MRRKGKEMTLSSLLVVIQFYRVFLRVMLARPRTTLNTWLSAPGKYVVATHLDWVSVEGEASSGW
jgi:hypothetical protein